MMNLFQHRRVNPVKEDHSWDDPSDDEEDNLEHGNGNHHTSVEQQTTTATTTFSSIITSTTLGNLASASLEVDTSVPSAADEKWTRRAQTVLERSREFPLADLSGLSPFPSPELPIQTHNNLETLETESNITLETLSTLSPVEDEPESGCPHDWTQLPIETVHRICTWLTSQEIMNWGQTNHHFHEFLVCEEVFHFLLVRDFHLHREGDNQQEVNRIRYFQIEKLLSLDSSGESLDSQDSLDGIGEGVDLEFGFPTKDHHYDAHWVQEKSVDFDDYGAEFWHDHPELYEMGKNRGLREHVTLGKVRRIQSLCTRDMISYRDGYVFLFVSLGEYQRDVARHHLAYQRKKDTWMRYIHHEVFKYQPYEVFFRWIKIVIPVAFIVQMIVSMMELDGLIEPNYILNFSPWFSFWILSHLANYFLVIRKENTGFKLRYVFIYLITLSLYITVAAGFVVFYFVVMILWAYFYSMSWLKSPTLLLASMTTLVDGVCAFNIMYLFFVLSNNPGFTIWWLTFPLIAAVVVSFLEMLLSFKRFPGIWNATEMKYFFWSYPCFFFPVCVSALIYSLKFTWFPWINNSIALAPLLIPAVAGSLVFSYNEWVGLEASLRELNKDNEAYIPTLSEEDQPELFDLKRFINLIHNKEVLFSLSRLSVEERDLTRNARE